MSTNAQSPGQFASGNGQLPGIWVRNSSHMGEQVRKIGDFLIERPALVQGIYYGVTGLWPLVLVHLFRSTSGEAMWLSQVGGVLMLVIGAALCLAAYRHDRTAVVWTVGLGSAAGLLLLELVFVIRSEISAVYLIDAFLQAGVVCLWLTNWLRHRGETSIAQGMSAASARPAPAAATPPATAAH
jgi:hypothetical protein